MTNGPSAAGKSTVVRRVQIPFLRVGVDESYRTVPGGCAGGTPGARHRRSRPVGISLGQLLAGPLCADPDLLLDTSGTSADTVWSRLVARYPALTSRGPGEVGGPMCPRTP
ncbi:hypothetical protein [Nonomuraea sp. NPDC050643]|uniref:hypothetical protein n=1 Tax=Nonomuraea sp. NPDC050643 TaxID=3155660 RepID=UPI0033DFF28A